MLDRINTFFYFFYFLYIAFPQRVYCIEYTSYNYIFFFNLMIFFSWPKICAPLHFCQIMHHFSRKTVAMTNALVCSCRFLLFALERRKKSRGKKADSETFYTELQKRQDKIIGTFSKSSEIIVFQACDAHLVCN